MGAALLGLRFEDLDDRVARVDEGRVALHAALLEDLGQGAEAPGVQAGLLQVVAGLGERLAQAGREAAFERVEVFVLGDGALALVDHAVGDARWSGTWSVAGHADAGQAQQLAFDGCQQRLGALLDACCLGAGTKLRRRCLGGSGSGR
ncbi:hypothetical protein BKM31_58705 [[Actinomadura] parvosata subsp. kistnae]|uniref:Uncharacterized protein n=1 Tax=[Actinomadura] parvosata subsp. kistnae TaxID=1909395 RepID=A0A1V0AIG6_9ACTN|nr:hypothetical protein BKM31_58705 [Nonomuraea sp. ATCC 55076]